MPCFSLFSKIQKIHRKLVCRIFLKNIEFSFVSIQNRLQTIKNNKRSCLNLYIKNKLECLQTKIKRKHKQINKKEKKKIRKKNIPSNT